MSARKQHVAVSARGQEVAMSAPHRSRTRRGLTLIELVLALGLLSLLMIAVFQLVDRSLSLWNKGETRRSLLEVSATVSELLADDLRGLEPGARGDFVLEWVNFDTDGDGVAETKWPRMRLVRQASAGDVQRVRAQDTPRRGSNGQGDVNELGAIEFDASSPALLEVVWMITPASLTVKDARVEGLVWRGERVVGDEATKSFFAPDFFGASNRPPAGATEEVTGGVLWMQLLCATQTSVVHDAWKLGQTADCVATSWDAWGRGRPDVQEHPWNEAQPGMPRARDRAVLPRRVRVEIEIERPLDRVRRTWTTEPLESADSALRVDDGERIPRGDDAYVLVEGEWMKVLSVDGHLVSVLRGQRGTRAVPHPAKLMVHFGERLAREIPIATYREDWDLR